MSSVTWATVGSGYNAVNTFVDAHPQLVSEVWDARLVQTSFVDAFSFTSEVITFIFQIFCVSLVLLAILAFGYNIIAPFVRRLGQW